MSNWWYGPGNAKNLHGRIIEDKGDTVVFRNADGKSEETQVIKRSGDSVVVCAESGDWLRLWK